MDAQHSLGLPRYHYIIVIIAVLIYQASAGPICYVCSGNGADSKCELKPSDFQFGPGTVNCSGTFCSAVKVIKKDTEETDSFARLCDTVDRGNWCFHDPNFITCYMTCRHDYCNSDNPNHMIMKDGNSNLVADTNDIRSVTGQLDDKGTTMSEFNVKVRQSTMQSRVRSTSYPPTQASVYETVIDRPVKQTTRRNYYQPNQRSRTYQTTSPKLYLPTPKTYEPEFSVNKYYEHHFSSPSEKGGRPHTRIVRDDVVYIDDAKGKRLDEVDDQDEGPSQKTLDSLDAPLMELLAPLLKHRDKTDYDYQLSENVIRPVLSRIKSPFKPIFITGYHGDDEEEEAAENEIEVDDIADKLKGTADDYELLNLKNHIRKMKEAKAKQNDYRTQLTKPPTIRYGTMQKLRSDGPITPSPPNKKREKPSRKEANTSTGYRHSVTVATIIAAFVYNLISSY